MIQLLTTTITHKFPPLEQQHARLALHGLEPVVGPAVVAHLQLLEDGARLEGGADDAGEDLAHHQPDGPGADILHQKEI